MQVHGKLLATSGDNGTIELTKTREPKVGDRVLVQLNIESIDGAEVSFREFYNEKATKSMLAYIFSTPPQDSIVVPERYDEPSNSKWCSTYDHNLIVNCLTQMKKEIEALRKEKK